MIDTEIHSIRIRLLHHPIKTLGPGSRIGLWLQGCSLHCEGCLSQEMWPFEGGRVLPVKDLAARIKAACSDPALSLDGLTVSGGEPFDQPPSFLELLRELDSAEVRDVLVFSGYSVTDLLARYPEIPVRIAALVDGPFRLGQETEAAWKGSSNQTLTIFRPEYRERYTRWEKMKKGKLQLLRDDQGLFLAGIPLQKDASELRKKILSWRW
ncbi:MAG: radical SAM protein [Synergistaceae bacterium]|nr:radical SAM protein [Synergistaceae bacterium]